MMSKTMTWKLALSLVGLMLWAGMSWGSDAPATSNSPDPAMRAFTQAMLRKDPRRLLAFFPRESAWKFQSYEIGTNKLTSSNQVSYAKLVNDFQKKTNWYGFFFNDPNGYTFRLHFIRGERWRKEGPDLFIAPRSEDGRTYIRWKRERGRWVIAEISETAP